MLPLAKHARTRRLLLARFWTVVIVLSSNEYFFPTTYSISCRVLRETCACMCVYTFMYIIRVPADSDRLSIRRDILST